MKTDPKRRSDGRCARPGCTKKLAAATKQKTKYAGDDLQRDPFCSSDCCRIYHGCPLEYVIGRRPDVEIIHVCGTSGAYYTSGCRCDLCREYVNDIARRKRARQKAARESESAVAA